MTRSFIPSLVTLGILLGCLSPLAAEAEVSPVATVLSIRPEAEHSAAPLTDLWIARMTEARERRQRAERWGVPLLLGSAAGLGAVAALLPDIATETRLVFAGSAALAVGALVPSLLAAPPDKARWLAAGGAAFAAAFGAAGVVQAMTLDDCTGWCGNERAVGWLGGALFTQGVLLFPLAFVDRGPGLDELTHYAALPASERVVVGRKLLARIDRAERKAAAIAVALGLVSSVVFGAGAAIVRERDEQVPLLALGGVTIGTTTINALVGLLRTSRLERLALGRTPSRVERVLW